MEQRPVEETEKTSIPQIKRDKSIILFSSTLPFAYLDNKIINGKQQKQNIYHIQ